MGSSPLARGLPRESNGHIYNRGIIPARAGFTTHVNRSGKQARDHPRSRGVYLRTQFRHGRMRGSSPLARGLRFAEGYYSRELRIIPARAGFTRREGRRGVRRRDHPRSRGVYPPSLLRSGYPVGSSPLARGLHIVPGHHERNTGIIPARAGFTWAHESDFDTAVDHPRSRGVYRGDVLNELVHRGIIPARAGFTNPPRD